MRYSVTCIILFLGVLVYSLPAFSQKPTSREVVQGKACYAFGDDETPKMAKKKAEIFARERAVSGYRVWVESSSKVKDYELQEELIQSISAGMLHKVTIAKEVWDGREICIEISAEIDPHDIGIEVARRQDQQTIKRVLNDFTTAYENRDILQLKRTTSMSESRARNLDLMFKIYTVIDTHVEIVSTSESQAKAKFVIDKLINKAGKTITPNSIIRETTITIPKKDGEWGKIQW